MANDGYAGREPEADGTEIQCPLMTATAAGARPGTPAIPLDALAPGEAFPGSLIPARPMPCSTPW